MKIKLSRALNDNYLVQDQLGDNLNDLMKLFDFVRTQSLDQGIILIVSSENFEALSTDALRYLEEQEIELIVVIGAEKIKSNIQIQFIQFQSEEEFINSGLLESRQRKFFILRSSPDLEFQDAITLFTRRSHKTCLEIDLKRIEWNINAFRAKLHENTKLMVMVKAFGYGAGSVEISKWLQHLMVDYLGVAFIDEGIELRQNGVELPIMVMSPGPNDAAMLIKYDLEPEIYEMAQLKSYVEAFKKRETHLPVHIMLNTGMNRLGFDKEELDELIEILNNNKNIKLKSLQTHLAASDMPSEKEFTNNQIQQFSAMAQILKTQLGVNPLLHNLNSSGIKHYAEHQMDMVRLGIGMHGISSEKDFLLKFPTRLKSNITQIRKVAKGETIGYGRVGKAIDDLMIATIPIGYADGYLRDYSNGKAYVMVNGQKAYTIGNVCMDMTMIDVTDIDCAVNDEVVIFGEDPNIEILANWSGSIPYEVLTTISSRVQRTYII